MNINIQNKHMPKGHFKSYSESPMRLQINETDCILLKTSKKRLKDAIEAFCQYAQHSRGKSYAQCPYYININKTINAFLGIKTQSQIVNLSQVVLLQDAYEITIELINKIIDQKNDYHDLFKKLKIALKDNHASSYR